MKPRGHSLKWLRWAIVPLAMLLPACVAFGQSDNAMAGAGGVFAALAGMMTFLLIFGLAFYIYLALALQTIAQKTNTENAWMAWIPIVNIFLMLNIAKKPLWWFILLLIPLVNIVIGIMIWMGVAEARGKPSWWGILIIVPVVGLIVPGYLAWVD